MLLLLFEIGSGRYALETNRIVEIVPLVNLKKIPSTPAFIAGLMNYRGDGMPVIDLCQLVDNSPFENLLSTRIIIIRCPIENFGDQSLGLIANNVTETVRSKLNKPPPTGVFMDSSLYNGAETQGATEMIQWFDVKKMLPEEEIVLLFEEEK